MLEGLLQSIREKLGLGVRPRTSALYTFLNTNSIGAGVEVVMDLELGTGDFSIQSGTVAEIQDHLPFTNLSLKNGDTNNSVRCTPQNEPAHSIVILPRAAEDMATSTITRFKVTNLGSGTIAAGAIVVTLWNE